LLPSVPPMLPLPMTAILMPASNQSDPGLIPAPVADAKPGPR